MGNKQTPAAYYCFFFVFFLKGDRREKRCRGVKRLSGKNVDAKGVSGRANLQ